MAVDVKGGSKFEAGVPKALFETRLAGAGGKAVAPVKELDKPTPAVPVAAPAR